MELRKDYILNNFVIISEKRGKRPFEFKKEPAKIVKKKCFFCPGNEDQTPPEIGRTDLGRSWKIRWFDNKFAAVTPEGNPEIRTDNEFFTFADAYGYHEIIVDTNLHGEHPADFDEEDWRKVLKVYGQRIEDLEKDEKVKYVNLFKNHGIDAGTSLVHSHSQIITTQIVPRRVQEKVKALRAHREKKDSCAYCEILNIEKQSDRRCFENETFVSFTPYASRYHFENWIFPKRHTGRLKDLSEEELNDLGKILKEVLGKIKKLNASYNLCFHYAPKGEDLHFHIEVLPRLTTPGGFELGTEIIINTLSPEKAASFYRGEVEKGNKKQK